MNQTRGCLVQSKNAIRCAIRPMVALCLETCLKPILFTFILVLGNKTDLCAENFTACNEQQQQQHVRVRNTTPVQK